MSTVPPGPPGPGPIDHEEKYLPGVTLTGKLWDNGPFGRMPSWLQLIVRAEISHLEESNYLNHYLKFEYRIVDVNYFFYPNPPIPGREWPPWDRDAGWWQPEFNGSTLIPIPKDTDDYVVVWNLMFTQAGGDTDDIDLIREYEGVEVRATLYGGNGEDFGMEELHNIAEARKTWELQHTMFAAPENPNDHITPPPEGTVVGDN